MTTDKAQDFVPFPESNICSKCNDRRVPGPKFSSQSTMEFLGIDHVRLLGMSALGGEREATYQVQVK